MTGPSERWTAVRTEDGSWTFRDERVGEACHSSAGAWLEARERYVLPCGLHEARGESLRLLDVGTGLGWNLAAALEATAGRGLRLEVTTLELERELLELVLESFERRPELRHPPAERWHAAVRAALGAALAGTSEERDAVPLGTEDLGVAPGSLTLLLGDARSTLPALPSEPGGGGFDAVFLDPFSPGRAPELWEPGFLAEVARRMAPGARLSTYSVAGRVRRALTSAGLVWEPGPPVGRKREGTVARLAPAPVGTPSGPFFCPAPGVRGASVD